jgi:hypothetical protein
MRSYTFICVKVQGFYTLLSFFAFFVNLFIDKIIILYRKLKVKLCCFNQAITYNVTERVSKRMTNYKFIAIIYYVII